MSLASISSMSGTQTLNVIDNITNYTDLPGFTTISVSNSSNYTVTNYVDPSDSNTYTQVMFTSGNNNKIKFTNPSANHTIYMLAVAGGGQGGGIGGNGGGGGGAGGFTQVGPLSISNDILTISIGNGGNIRNNSNNRIGSGQNGENTTIRSIATLDVSLNITCIGGGGGGTGRTTDGSNNYINKPGGPYTGGSGGGFGRGSKSNGVAASGTISQGYSGGYTANTVSWGGSAGGGGAGGVGGYGSSGQNNGVEPFGGIGRRYTLYGYDRTLYWAGGGGGASDSQNGGKGGLGGGGGGACNKFNTVSYIAGTGGGSALNSGTSGTESNVTSGTYYAVGGNGGTNTGGGGGGSFYENPIVNTNCYGGAGGSGVCIVMIRN